MTHRANSLREIWPAAPSAHMGLAIEENYKLHNIHSHNEKDEMWQLTYSRVRMMDWRYVRAENPRATSAPMGLAIMTNATAEASATHPRCIRGVENRDRDAEVVMTAGSRRRCPYYRRRLIFFIAVVVGFIVMERIGGEVEVGL